MGTCVRTAIREAWEQAAGTQSQRCQGKVEGSGEALRGSSRKADTRRRHWGWAGRWRAGEGAEFQAEEGHVQSSGLRRAAWSWVWLGHRGQVHHALLLGKTGQSPWHTSRGLTHPGHELLLFEWGYNSTQGVPILSQRSQSRPELTSS